MSSGYDDDIAISGEIFGTSESDGEAPKIISDVIVREYKEKNPQIGIIYSDVLKEMPEIEDIISSILSPEDMANLKNLGSGGSLLRTFGF
jgi:FMN-dependent NADH-azoreductase